MLARSSHQPPTKTTHEVSLLLRAHAEQRWLSREVVPVVRQLSTREALPEEQLPAALAYLEVIWIEAVQRAGDTDKALTCLDLSLPAPQSPDCLALAARARRYRAAVLVLREAVSRRVAGLLALPGEDWAMSADGDPATPEGRAISGEGNGDRPAPGHGAYSDRYPSESPASNSSRR